MELKDKQKIVKVIGEAEKVLDALERSIYEKGDSSKSSRQLLKSINHSLDLLKSNPFIGQPVKHELWPKEYAGLPNLFRMELSQFWRLLYYVIGDEVKVISVVFEIHDHKRYDSIFGYKKK